MEIFKIKSERLNKFLIRFSFIFLSHFIFKAGDQSFDSFFSFTMRGFAFSTYFTIYWLIVWYIASYFHQKIQAKQDASTKNKYSFTYLLFFSHLTYGLLASFVANWIYRFGDIYFFDMGEVWSSVNLFNPELTFSLLVIYMMVFSFDFYFQANMKRKEDQLQLEKLKQENMLAQYLNLKSQIEPHFLFNSLSVLSSIINSNADLATEFTLRLSRILRYVIEKNELFLVPLSDEIIFVENYLFLIQTRFENGIVFENTIDEKLIESAHIPPVSLQLLIENAIKHNKFTDSKPLNIRLYSKNSMLIVENNIKLRTDIKETTEQGLENLSQRFVLISDQSISIEKTDLIFRVSLPILNKDQYESFNI